MVLELMFVAVTLMDFTRKKVRVSMYVHNVS